MRNKTKKVVSKGKKKTKKAGSNGRISAEDLNLILTAAEEAFNEANLDESRRLYIQAIQYQPDNTKLLDGLAVVDLQLGEVEEALGLLKSSIALAPTENPSKWFYFAQLQTNKDALQAYEQGISILQQQLNSELEIETKRTINEQICDAYCAVAELFMTDLCFEENAEVTCESAITKALEAVPNNLGALQTLASFRISQCRAEDACIILENLVNIVSQKLDNYVNRKISEELINSNPTDLASVPSIEFLIPFCKLLIECSCHRDSFSSAANKILEQILDLDDENPEIWYLLGFNEEHKPNNPDVDAARGYYESGIETIEKLIEADPSARQALQDYLEIFQTSISNIDNPSVKVSGEAPSLLTAFSKSKSTKFGAMGLMDEEEEEEGQWEDEMET